jgi:hypothetical protein
MYHFLLSPYGGPTKANYQHACIVFAEGLKALNISFNANINYYPDVSGTFLFTKGSETDAIYIVTSAPEEFILPANKKLIIFDTKDEWVRPKSLQFLSIAHRYFMSSTSENKITATLKPYAFALSNRMIENISFRHKPWAARKKAIVWSHRVSNHSLRNLVKSFYAQAGFPIATFLDNFAVPDTAIHWWNHTGRRHSPAYFEYLSNYCYLDAHGGYPVTTTSIQQWDSWKVWEGFAAGVLVITADLDYYNIRLPYRLIPYVHYIPIRYDQLDASYERLFSLPDAEQECIARAGHTFVMNHYTPVNMANYVIEELGKKSV